MSAVIVTGGAGFIGSNLVDALIADGREVHVVDNLSTGRRTKLNPAATFHEMDIRDAAGLRALAERARPTAVFHLAAQADVRKALQ
ncbi:MAG TPA: NAD-dependent epimerase/dehydratase family protein, partial [Miltoncostaeaceae bacterium]|nr:NAD-dependent epimerase/dehydratase family protein [Miltoncostaeaceae bacterium]